SPEYKVRFGATVRAGGGVFQQLGGCGNVVGDALSVGAAAAVGAGPFPAINGQRNFVLRCHCFPNSLSIVSLHDKSVVTGVQSPASHAAASKRHGQVRSKDLTRQGGAARTQGRDEPRLVPYRC